MKKIFTVLISVLLLLSFSFCAFSYDYGYGARTALANDLAQLMSLEDTQTLNAKLEQVSELYECEIAVLTVNSTDGKDITAFADDYYDYNGFGYGENADGIMLVVDMDMREYAITTCGEAIFIFDDYSLYLIEAEFVSYLSEGRYTEAFISFYEECSGVLADYYYEDTPGDNYYVNSDDAYSDGYDYGYGYDGNTGSITADTEIFSLQWIGISLIGGIVIALIYTYFLKSQLKTVHSKSSAADYVVEGSISITRSRDIYLHKNIRKTPKPKSNSTSGRSGGSVHVSSSGRSHGGSRGSF